MECFSNVVWTCPRRSDKHNVRFIALSFLFGSGLGAVVPEMQPCLAKPGRGKKEVREESKKGKRREERNPSPNTGLKAQAVSETYLKAMKVTKSPIST